MFSADQRIIFSIIVFVYFIFLFVLALYINRRTKTYEEYNVAGKSVSLFPIILTFIGTGVGGSTLFGYMENGYSLGMGQQWIHITMFICVAILAIFLLKRVRCLGKILIYLFTLTAFQLVRQDLWQRAWPTKNLKSMTISSLIPR